MRMMAVVKGISGPVAIAAWLAAAGATAAPVAAQGLNVVYEPTPHETVERMLNAANVRANDFVIDLGSGDGRIAIAAARRGARALGVDLDPARIREAQQNAQRAGVAGRASFRQEDLFKTPLGGATVVTLYLLPELNVRLAPRLLSLPAGTRIVSHRFPMGDWKPDQTDTNGGTVYFWIVPARVAGNWRIRHEGAEFTVAFTQRNQELGGSASVGKTTTTVRAGRLRGTAIDFTLDLGGRATRFRGTVSGNAMHGAPAGLGLATQASSWSASRI